MKKPTNKQTKPVSPKGTIKYMNTKLLTRVSAFSVSLTSFQCFKYYRV